MKTDLPCPKSQCDIMELLCSDQWSNAACCGYLIIASETLGLPNEQLQLLLDAMENAFEHHTVENAKKIYMNY